MRNLVLTIKVITLILSDMIGADYIVSFCMGIIILGVQQCEVPTRYGGGRAKPNPQQKQSRVEFRCYRI